MRFRYFKSKSLAFRLGLSVTGKTTEDKTILIPAPTLLSQSIITENSGFDLNLGVEKHFSGSNRLSPYMGVDAIFASKSFSKNENFSNGDYFYYKNTDGTTNKSSTILGLRLVSGVDFYIAKKL